MLFIFLLFSNFVACFGRIDMLITDMELLKANPMTSENVTEQTLQSIVFDEWSKIVGLCPGLDINANIQAQFDSSLVSTSTLAWASHTLLLKDFVWVPSIATIDYVGYDFIIGVNPSPVNGWHIGENCSDVSYRYDLRTVLRHEMLHGIGIGSSIRKSGSTWSVGHEFSGMCFPRYYDTLIEDREGNTVVDGCTFKKNLDGENIYINGVKLFNPTTYYAGSSISHHVYSGDLLYWQLPAMKCIQMQDKEFKILSQLGLDCLDSSQLPSNQYYPFLFLIPLALAVFLF